MIGVSKLLSAGATAIQEFNVTCIPSTFELQITKGTITTPAAEANVIGGVAAFTYEWTVDNPSISIQTPDESSTTFRASGVSGTIEGVATCRSRTHRQTLLPIQ